MADKFLNKYRIPSARWQHWDYGSNAPYFVTICTHHRYHYFGKVVDGQMKLSELGLLAYKYWNEIPDHFPFVILDAFVVMPNHVHGIIIIDKPNDDNPQTGIMDDVQLGNGTHNEQTGRGTNNVQTGHEIHNEQTGHEIYNVQTGHENNNVQTGHALSLPPNMPNTIGQQRFRNQGKNTLSSIIGSYKSAVTKNAHHINTHFAWQTRFHDHVIRNTEACQRIHHYIINNPQKWQADKFNG